MRKLILDVGSVYSWLIVVAPAGKDNRGRTTYLFRCKCGSEVVLTATCVKSGNNKSCGCQRKPHGMTRSPEFLVWKGMIDRCTRRTDPAWDRYGGRGIKVCERWVEFKNFYEDMGPRPAGYQLDRIDNDGPYEPDNCRWATRSENGRNKRTNRIVTYQGRDMSLTEAAELTGLSFMTLWHRLNRGETGDRLFRPARYASHTDYIEVCASGKGVSVKRGYWTPEEVEKLAKLYPHYRSEDVADLLGREKRSVYNKAMSLGIKKTAAFLASGAAGRFGGASDLPEPGDELRQLESA